MEPLDTADPFTPGTAARAGVGRADLERAVRSGRIVRLFRGVYVGGLTTLTPGLRAQALALVVSPRHVVAGPTAAWVHGAPVAEVLGPVPLDVVAPGAVAGADVDSWPGLRCTTAERTAVDLARSPRTDVVLPLLDGLLRAGALTHAELVGRCRWERDLGLGGRELVAMADGRAAGPAESVLRLRWHTARLPTPVPGLGLLGSRLALGLPAQRFGVSIDDAPWAGAPGWTVLAVAGGRVTGGDPEALVARLEREYHRHLLWQSERGTA